MDALPTNAAGLVAAVPGDAVANVPDSPQFLDVQVQQLPRAQPP